MSENHSCLSKVGLGLSVGITAALYMLAMSLAASCLGWGGDAMAFISSMYVGYDTSAVGTLVGMGWGFVDGFIFGFLVAFFYNWSWKCCTKCCKKE